MQPIVFNRSGSRINRSMEAFALRAAYLLGGRPILGGDSAAEIFFKRDSADLPILRKLEMLVTFYKNNDEYHPVFTEMLKTMKRSSGTRMKTKELIVAYRKMEQSVATCWETASQHIEDWIDSFGFGIVRQLNDEHIFGHLTTSPNPETESEDRITASDLMKLFTVEEDESQQLTGLYNTPELFFLGSEFMADSYAKPPICRAPEAEAANPASVYLERCFTFPNLNTLTAAELQALRAQLPAAGGSAFCQAVDEWCDSCYDNQPPASRVSIFQTQVLPAADVLQQALESNAILQQCRRLHERHATTEVWAGEIPVLRLWQFYRDFEVLNDDTWQKLQAETNNPDYHDQRWPVLLLKSNEPLHPEPEDEMKAVKRYLSID